MKNNVIIVENLPINIITNDTEDYICLSDIAKAKGGNSKSDDIIRNWLRNRVTLEFLGTWEMLYNPNSKPALFDGFRKENRLKDDILNIRYQFNIVIAKKLYSIRNVFGFKIHDRK